MLKKLEAKLEQEDKTPNQRKFYQSAIYAFEVIINTYIVYHESLLHESSCKT